MKIKDLPKVDRQREKLIAKGAENLYEDFRLHLTCEYKRNSIICLYYYDQCKQTKNRPIHRAKRGL